MGVGRIQRDRAAAGLGDSPLRPCHRLLEEEPKLPSTRTKLRLPAFVPPPEELASSFVAAMREDPQNDYESRAPSPARASNSEPHGRQLNCGHVTTALRQWEDADKTKSAKPFDMAADLPGLWSAVWLIKGWAHLKRVKVC